MKYIVISKWVDNSYNESMYHKVFNSYKEARKYVADGMKSTKQWALDEGWDEDNIQTFYDEHTKKYCIWEEKWEDHYWIQKLNEAA